MSEESEGGKGSILRPISVCVDFVLGDSWDVVYGFLRVWHKSLCFSLPPLELLLVVIVMVLYLFLVALVVLLFGSTGLMVVSFVCKVF